MKIELEVKNIYGNSNLYPVCDKAKLLVLLTGKKTFSAESIGILKALGYKPVLAPQRQVTL